MKIQISLLNCQNHIKHNKIFKTYAKSACYAAKNSKNFCKIRNCNVIVPIFFKKCNCLVEMQFYAV